MGKKHVKVNGHWIETMDSSILNPDVEDPTVYIVNNIYPSATPPTTITNTHTLSSKNFYWNNKIYFFSGANRNVPEIIVLSYDLLTRTFTQVSNYVFTTQTSATTPALTLIIEKNAVGSSVVNILVSYLPTATSVLTVGGIKFDCDTETFSSAVTQATTSSNVFHFAGRANIGFAQTRMIDFDTMTISGNATPPGTRTVGGYPVNQVSPPFKTLVATENEITYTNNISSNPITTPITYLNHINNMITFAPGTLETIWVKDVAHSKALYGRQYASSVFIGENQEPVTLYQMAFPADSSPLCSPPAVTDIRFFYNNDYYYILKTEGILVECRIHN